MFLAKPCSLANRLIESSDSPIFLISPQMLMVLLVLVKWPESSSSAKARPIEAWSLAWMMRLEAELLHHSGLRLLMVEVRIWF